MRRRRKSAESLVGASLPDFRSSVNNKTKADNAVKKNTKRGASGSFRHRSLLILLAASVVGLFWLVYSSQIRNISVVVTTDTAKYVPIDDIRVQSIIQDYVNSSPERSWFINNQDLEGILTQEYTSVDSVLVRGVQSQTLTVEISAKERVILWQSKGLRFAVDVEGFAFRQVSEDDITGQLVVDDSGINVEVGKAVATADFVKVVSQLSELLVEERFSADMFIAPEAPREVHLRLTGKPYLIKMLTTESPAVSVQALQDSLDYLAGEGIVPASHLDLRVVGKAVYR